LNGIAGSADDSGDRRLAIGRDQERRFEEELREPRRMWLNLENAGHLRSLSRYERTFRTGPSLDFVRITI
jgi:hypothetical protein